MFSSTFNRNNIIKSDSARKQQSRNESESITRYFNRLKGAPKMNHYN